MADDGTGGDLRELGALEPVDARDVWPHEAYNFTPWLLAHAAVVGAALGMDLELSAAEHPVGSFSLDLIGVDRATGDSVIVENQLTPTDHAHLGQLLTYAGGTDAVNVVWIATRFREEHRAALDWLNGRTDESTRFFGVEIRVVRIGLSLPAPLLTVVAQPNDWGKSVRARTAAEGPGAKGVLYQQFWARFLDQLTGRRLTWTQARKAQAQNWLTMPSGTSGVVFNCSFGRTGLSSEVFFQDAEASVNEARFASVVAARASIESTYGGTLQFEQLVGRKGCRVADYRAGQIPLTEQWDDYTEWFIASQSRLRTAMSGIVNVSPADG